MWLTFIDLILWVRSSLFIRLLTGDKYTDNREILLVFNSNNWLPSNINVDVNLLTKGSDFLTYQENTTIFKHAFKYIKDSKRFTIV